MTTYLNERGEYLGGIPAEAVADCAHAGACDEGVTSWREKLGFTVEADRARVWLRDFGAWDRDELAAMSEVELAERVLWLACGDLKERGEWLGLVH